MLFSTRKYWAAMTDKECRSVMAALRRQRCKGIGVSISDASSAPEEGSALHDWLDKRGMTDAEIMWRLHSYHDKCTARWRNQIPKLMLKLSGLKDDI
jgi:hypothetical protein